MDGWQLKHSRGRLQEMAEIRRQSMSQLNEDAKGLILDDSGSLKGLVILKCSCDVTPD